MRPRGAASRPVRALERAAQNVPVLLLGVLPERFEAAGLSQTVGWELQTFLRFEEAETRDVAYC